MIHHNIIFIDNATVVIWLSHIISEDKRKMSERIVGNNDNKKNYTLTFPFMIIVFEFRFEHTQEARHTFSILLICFLIGNITRISENKCRLNCRFVNTPPCFISCLFSQDVYIVDCFQKTLNYTNRLVYSRCILMMGNQNQWI